MIEILDVFLSFVFFLILFYFNTIYLCNDKYKIYRHNLSRANYDKTVSIRTMEGVEEKLNASTIFSNVTNDIQSNKIRKYVSDLYNNLNTVRMYLDVLKHSR